MGEGKVLHFQTIKRGPHAYIPTSSLSLARRRHLFVMEISSGILWYGFIFFPLGYAPWLENAVKYIGNSGFMTREIYLFS